MSHVDREFSVFTIESYNRTITDGLRCSPGWTTTVGNYTAWMQSNGNHNIIHVYDGNTVKQIQVVQNGFSPSLFYMTESLISFQNVDNNGTCFNNTVYFLETEILVSKPCQELYASNSINLIARGVSNHVFEILDKDYQPIFQMPFTYQGFSLFSVPRTMSYWKNFLFFNNSNDLMRFNTETNVLELANASTNQAFFFPFRNDGTLAFLETTNFVDYDVFHYNGSTTQLLLQNENYLNQHALSFQDQVYWQTSENEVLRYDLQNGVIDTLLNANSIFVCLNATDCYVIWGAADFSTNSSTLFLYDGNTTSPFY